MGGRAFVAMHCPTGRRGRPRRRSHRQSRPVVLGGPERSRAAQSRRDRADQRRDRNVRTPGRPDREISRAKKVVATGRNAASLQSLKALGADETIRLTEETDALDVALKKCFANGVDVVLDYLWGRSA